MFQNFYTTKMSGNKKVLQKRFTQIRAGGKYGKTARLMATVLTLVIFSTTAFATIVMAAVGSDGLEHFDKNEIYFVAAMKSTVQVDLDKMPNWIKDISSNGSIDFQVDYVNIKGTTSAGFGNCKPALIAKFSGDKGNSSISNGLNAANYNYDFSFCNFSDDEKAFIIWFPLDNDLNIISYSVCFTTQGSDDIAFSHTDLHKENYIGIDDNKVQFIGDFEGILKQTEYYTMNDYFTFYEKNYQNKNVEGIDMKVLKLDDKGLSVKINVSRSEPDTFEVCVRKKENILKCGKYILKPLSDVNNTELRIDEKNLAFNYRTETMKYTGSKDVVWTSELSEMANAGYLISGEEYVVDMVLTKTNADESKNVLYRQREYVTIK